MLAAHIPGSEFVRREKVQSWCQDQMHDVRRLFVTKTSTACFLIFFVHSDKSEDLSSARRRSLMPERSSQMTTPDEPDQTALRYCLCHFENLQVVVLKSCQIKFLYARARITE